MENLIKYEYFKIDMLSPVLSAGAALLITQGLGRLGHYSVSAQATVLLSFVTGLVRNLALIILNNNNFPKSLNLSAFFAAVPVGVLAGISVHHFFYPQTALNQVINRKDFVILSIALTALSIGLLSFEKVWWVRKFRKILEDYNVKVEEVNTISLALKISLVLGATHIVRFLGHYSVSTQTTALLAVMGLVSSRALKFFEKTFDNAEVVYWGSISDGVIAGIAAHRFFYPQIALNKVIGMKDFVILSTALISIKVFLNYLYQWWNEQNKPDYSHREIL